MARVLGQAEPSRRELARLVVVLSLPTVVAEVCNTAMEYIDTAMVGSLGAQASASIGLVASSTWLVGGLCTGASVGFTVQIAQLVGARREAEARNVLRQGLVVLLAFSLLLAAAGAAVSGPLPRWLGGDPAIAADASRYFLVFALALPFAQAMRLCVGALQCAGDMRTPSMLNVLMCALDVAFNFFLIFPTRPAAVGGLALTVPGAGLGVTGAALGTALAEAVTAALLLFATCVRSEKLALVGRRGAPGAAGGGASGSAESWRLDPRRLVTAAKVAFPVCLERVVTSGAQIVSTAIVAPLGTVAVAAHSLAITAEGLCYMPGYGVGAAATTLVGQAFGAGRRDLARRLANLCVALGMAIMACTGALMYVLAPAVFALFTPDEGVRELGCAVLRIELFAEPLFAASIVAMGALRGAGDTLVPTLLNIGCMWCVRIVLALVLVPSMGLYGVWVAMLCDLCVRGALFLVRLWRGKWLERASLA